MIAAALLAVPLLAAPPSPEVSAAGARNVGAPWAARELVRVCDRESRHSRIGEHRGPNMSGRRFYARAVAVGWLKPCQETDDLAERDAWGVRGPYGLVAAYHVRHLAGCARAEAVDVPIVAATLAARAWVDLRRRGFCDYQARRVAYKRGANSAEAREEFKRCLHLILGRVN